MTKQMHYNKADDYYSIWELEVYDIQEDEHGDLVLQESYRLPGVTSEQIWEAVDYIEDDEINPFLFRITSQQHVDTLQKYIKGHELDLSKHEYFIHYISVGKDFSYEDVLARIQWGNPDAIFTAFLLYQRHNHPESEILYILNLISKISDKHEILRISLINTIINLILRGTVDQDIIKQYITNALNDSDIDIQRRAKIAANHTKTTYPALYKELSENYDIYLDENEF